MGRVYRFLAIFFIHLAFAALLVITLTQINAIQQAAAGVIVTGMAFCVYALARLLENGQ